MWGEVSPLCINHEALLKAFSHYFVSSHAEITGICKSFTLVTLCLGKPNFASIRGRCNDDCSFSQLQDVRISN
jgi:hypothetical protein